MSDETDRDDRETSTQPDSEADDASRDRPRSDEREGPEASADDDTGASSETSDASTTSRESARESSSEETSDDEPGRSTFESASEPNSEVEPLTGGEDGTVDSVDEDEAAPVQSAERAYEEGLLPIDKENVEDLLLELGQISEACEFHTLYEEIHDERLEALRREEMTVVVLGEFNHGKSTVINALLREEVLPVGITPTTSVITHLVYGEQPGVTIHPSGGGDPYEIAYDEMEEVVRETEEASSDEIDHVEIAYPNDLLEDSLVLVDTPGVNDISRQKVEITYGYVPRADVVLYVLDATQILKKSEITFIEDRLLEANRDRIIFALGKIDALSDEEAAEVEAYAREELESMLGSPVELYAFSARDALEAQQDDETPPEGFRDFRSELIQYLRDQRANIILDSALGGGLRVAGLLEQNLAIERQAYRLEKEELEEKIEAVRSKLDESRQLIAGNLELIDERIGEIAATARHNLHVFRDEFKEKLPRQIEAAEARDVKLYLSAWIQDQFKEWLETEGADIANSLEELAEEVIEVTNESIRDVVETFRDEFGLAEELDLEVDTVAYDMSVFALGTLGVSVLLLANTLVGGLLTAATPVLAVFLKGKVDDKIKERAREEGLKAIDEATEAIEDELIRVVHEYGDRLEAFVENAGDRLYRQVQEALAQVRREIESKDRDQAIEEVDQRLEAVREVAGRLEAKRDELRSYTASD
jgi:small GTP-binding protein